MKRLSLDPRSKLFALGMTILVVSVSHKMEELLILVFVIALLGIAMGRVRSSIRAAVLFLCLYLIQVCYIKDHIGSLYTMFTAWLSLVYQLYPCCMLSGIMISTTRISEFLSALQKMDIPKHFIITCAVFLRYLPVIREDWSYIRDSMKMRGIALSVKGMILHPKRTVECLYVPLLIAASKAADELTMACVTRGIENPKRRTSWITIRLKAADYAVMTVFLAMLLFTLTGRI